MIGDRMWRIWLAEDAQATMLAAATNSHPHETGGILIGVHTRGMRPWVTHAVEIASPRASATFYEVPQGARHKSVAKLRRRDGRLGYLGEWHAHPLDIPPSDTDISTLARLAGDPDAGCPRPVLLVLRRIRSTYTIDAKQYAARTRPLRVITTGPTPRGAPARDVSRNHLSMPFYRSRR